MIIEQSNDRLIIKKGDGSIVIWLMLLLGIGIVATSLYWISLPLWVTVGSVLLVLISLLSALSRIWVPRFFFFDRITGVLTVLYQTRVLKWKIERKKIYPLQDIKDVIFITFYEYFIESYFTQLVIQRSKNKDYLEERVHIPGKLFDFRSIRNEAEAVASFLGLAIKEESRIVRDIDN
jgi:hypothetical protein